MDITSNEHSTVESALNVLISHTTEFFGVSSIDQAVISTSNAQLESSSFDPTTGMFGGPATNAAEHYRAVHARAEERFERILAHRRAHALQRCEFAAQASVAFTVIVDQLVTLAQEQGTEVNEVELYNYRLLARCHARTARRGDKIRQKRKAEAEKTMSGANPENTDGSAAASRSA